MAYPPSTLATVYSSQPASTGSTANWHALLHNHHDTSIGEIVADLGTTYNGPTTDAGTVRYLIGDLGEREYATFVKAEAERICPGLT